jgi:hypothetical protein
MGDKLCYVCGKPANDAFNTAPIYSDQPDGTMHGYVYIHCSLDCVVFHGWLLAGHALRAILAGGNP